MPPRRPCLEPGCPGWASTGPRCPAHRLLVERRKGARRARTPAERKRRAVAVAAWVQANGLWCPGWRDQPGHPSNDLTADHVWPVAAGGPEGGPLVVRCRSCNAARGARV